MGKGRPSGEILGVWDVTGSKSTCHQPQTSSLGLFQGLDGINRYPCLSDVRPCVQEFTECTSPACGWGTPIRWHAGHRAIARRVAIVRLGTVAGLGTIAGLGTVTRLGTVTWLGTVARRRSTSVVSRRPLAIAWLRLRRLSHQLMRNSQPVQTN